MRSNRSVLHRAAPRRNVPVTFTLDITMGTTKRMLGLLDDLEQLGFTDHAFGHLHHFRATRGVYDTIAAHRKYLQKHASVRGTNEKVQRRLELVLNAYRAGPFKRGAPVFLALAQAAVEEIPFDTTEDGDA